MEALHRQVLPFLLRRMKDDVLQDLPPKIIQDYYCNLSPLQVQKTHRIWLMKLRLCVRGHSCNAVLQTATKKAKVQYVQ